VATACHPSQETDPRCDRKREQRALLDFVLDPSQGVGAELRRLVVTAWAPLRSRSAVSERVSDTNPLASLATWDAPLRLSVLRRPTRFSRSRIRPAISRSISAMSSDVLRVLGP
jgi:hypothetical protein